MTPRHTALQNPARHMRTEHILSANINLNTIIAIVNMVKQIHETY